MLGTGRIGRYEVVAHLATGGMGQVFLARSAGPGGFVRHVVLKTLDLPGTSEDEAIAMFLDEARLLGLLHHQHITPVYELGKDEEGHFHLVMDYVHGHTAHDVWTRTHELGAALPIDFSLTVAAAAASGLHYAHTRRGADGRSLHIVHRDVTLSNLMIGFDGAVKLIDFGIAKAANRSTQTQAGFIKGKVGYMAPEQLRGLEVDARTDVFALGIVLYELSTMRRAFREDSDRATMEKIKGGIYVAPSLANPDYPPELERIVTRALRVDPRERYPDAESMRRDLDLLGHQLGLVLGDAAVVEVMTQLFDERGEPWEPRRPPRAETELNVALEIMPGAGRDDDTRPSSPRAAPLRAATEAAESQLETPPHGLPKRPSSFSIDGAPSNRAPSADTGGVTIVPLPGSEKAKAIADAVAASSGGAAGLKDVAGAPVPAAAAVEPTRPVRSGKPVKPASPPAVPRQKPTAEVAPLVAPPAAAPARTRGAAIGWAVFGLLAAGAIASGVYVFYANGSAGSPAESTDSPGAGSAKVTMKSTSPGSAPELDQAGSGDGSGAALGSGESSAGSGSGSGSAGSASAKPPIVLPPNTPIKLRIRSSPSDATVLLDGKRLGRTPYSGTASSSPGPHTLKLRKKGYVPLSIDLELSGDIDRELTLERAKSDARSAARDKSE